MVDTFVVGGCSLRGAKVYSRIIPTPRMHFVQLSILCESTISFVEWRVGPSVESASAAARLAWHRVGQTQWSEMAIHNR